MYIISNQMLHSYISVPTSLNCKDFYRINQVLLQMGDWWRYELN